MAKKHFSWSVCVLLFVCAALFSLASCSPSLSVSLSPDGTGAISWKGTLSPSSRTLVQRFTEPHTGSEGSLFKPEAIRISLALAGITAESVSAPDSASLAVKASIKDVNALPAGCLRFDGKKNAVTLTLSREVLAASLGLMPPETAEYIELLMAPAFTGEALSPAEYRDLIAAAYGKTIASELASSAFTLVLSCPGQLTRVESTAPATVKFSDKTANITIPLADLLTLEKPVIINAAW